MIIERLPEPHEQGEPFMVTVASIGAINPPDISKVVIAGSVVQLGVGVGGVETEVAEAATPVHPIPQLTSATLRYDVSPEGIDRNKLSGLGLQVRYRDGGGHVVATLIEVDVPAPRGADSGTVTERPLLTFDSAGGDFGGPFTSFVTKIEALDSGLPLGDHVMDFSSHAYYITLVLIGPAVAVAAHPPAVSSLGLILVTAV
jgi:hypothetical protein